jgi:hypothetical protein
LPVFASAWVNCLNVPLTSVVRRSGLGTAAPSLVVAADAPLVAAASEGEDDVVAAELDDEPFELPQAVVPSSRAKPSEPACPLGRAGAGRYVGSEGV